MAVELRRHHLDGRLDDAELEERLGRAYAARTLGELAALTLDLPAPDPPARRPVAKADPKISGYGLIGFAQTHTLEVGPAEAYDEALDTIQTAVFGHGYDLVANDPGRSLVFEMRERPAWVYVVCVAAFPIGLLALGVRTTARVRIDFVPGPGGGTRMVIAGEARRPLRKAFAEISG